MTSVLLGAFGAHGLKHRLTEHYLQVYQTGVEYQFYHALGLLVIAILIHSWPEMTTWLKWSGFMMLSGIMLFSGSLYLLSLTQIKWLGAITPIGGFLFILAWFTLFIGALKS